MVKGGAARAARAVRTRIDLRMGLGGGAARATKAGRPRIAGELIFGVEVTCRPMPGDLWRS